MVKTTQGSYEGSKCWDLPSKYTDPTRRSSLPDEIPHLKLQGKLFPIILQHLRPIFMSRVPNISYFRFMLHTNILYFFITILYISILYHLFNILAWSRCDIERNNRDPTTPACFALQKHVLLGGDGEHGHVTNNNTSQGRQSELRGSTPLEAGLVVVPRIHMLLQPDLQHHPLFTLQHAVERRQRILKTTSAIEECTQCTRTISSNY